MICVERHVQQIRPGKWAELEAIDKKYNTVESRLGFPAKRRYQCYRPSENDLDTQASGRVKLA
jgi:hypothetical protein